jgi:hypothetical protein
LKIFRGRRCRVMLVNRRNMAKMSSGMGSGEWIKSGILYIQTTLHGSHHHALDSHRRSARDFGACPSSRPPHSMQSQQNLLLLLAGCPLSRDSMQRLRCHSYSCPIDRPCKAGSLVPNIWRMPRTSSGPAKHVVTSYVGPLAYW